MPIFVSAGDQPLANLLQDYAIPLHDEKVRWEDVPSLFWPVFLFDDGRNPAMIVAMDREELDLAQSSVEHRKGIFLIEKDSLSLLAHRGLIKGAILIK